MNLIGAHFWRHANFRCVVERGEWSPGRRPRAHLAHLLCSHRPLSSSPGDRESVHRDGTSATPTSRPLVHKKGPRRGASRTGTGLDSISHEERKISYQKRTCGRRHVCSLQIFEALPWRQCLGFVLTPRNKMERKVGNGV